MTVWFAGEGEAVRPIALTRKPRKLGARVTVRLEPESLSLGAAYLLHRTGTDIVLMASLREPQAEAARRALGEAKQSYQVVRVDVFDHFVESP